APQPAPWLAWLVFDSSSQQRVRGDPRGAGAPPHNELLAGETAGYEEAGPLQGVATAADGCVGAHDSESHRVARLQGFLELSDVLHRRNRMAVDGDNDVFLEDADILGEGAWIDAHHQDAVLFLE